jgi:hypothetical protein
MANSTTAYGLRALGKLGSNPANGGQGQYNISDNYSTSIFQGDMVTVDAGYIAPVVTTTLTTVLGVFNGCLIEVSPTTGKPTWSNKYTQTNITQGEIQAYVIDDPNQLYLVKSTGTAAGQTAVGESYEQVYATGNTTNGISGVYLNLGASTTAQLRILQTSPFIGNEEGSTNEDFIVKIAGTLN